MGAYIGESYLRKLVVFYIPRFMFLAGMLFPFYWMLITSVKADSELYSAQSVPFLVSHVTADHWIYLFKDTLFLRWAWNTLFIATLSTALSLIAGTLAGYSLARLRFPGASTFGISIFVTYLVPPTLLFIPLADVVSDLGLYDSPWALIFTYPTFLES